jgi:hypothetical protein
MSTVAVVAACGGGGGGGSPSPTPVPTPAPTPGPTPAPTPAPTSITISGTARYESVPVRANGIGLNYSAITAKPIRGATVELLNGTGNTLATTVTDAQGAYSFSTTSNQALRVRVRAELKDTTPANGMWDMTVRSNTNGDALYTLDSAQFTPTASETRDLLAGSGWGGSSYSGVRAAAPFAILDVAYQGLQKVLSASPSINLPAVRLFWSTSNRPATNPNGSLDLAAGLIGTSHYRLSGNHALYLLGAEDSDTDEYDTHVVEHEFGHYLQSAVSEDDSVGGPHGSSDLLDMRVAFSEGWGNGWSGIALNDPRYFDTLSTDQANGFSFNVSTAPTSNRGWYSESTAQYLVWSVNADPNIGFTPIFNALQALKTEPTLTSLYSFGAAVKAAAPGGTAAVNNLWQQQQIFGTDALGTGETNNGGLPAVLPVYKAHTAALGVNQNYCVQATAADGSNKLGNFVYIRFTASGARTLTVTSTNGGAQTDPDFLLVQSNGTRQNSFSSAVNSEVLSTTLSAGSHVIALNDYTLPLSTTRCFNFKVD